MKTTIGGDRLGSGGKQEVSLKNYSRSSHDLSYLWRSSMSSGTLVPFMSELALPGDSFDINLGCEVLTLPTSGPLFGSYKVQLDVFSCPIRLYNGKLHMNKLGIGMDMSSIHLPQLELSAWVENLVPFRDNEQVHSSCIFSYLNIRGLGGVGTPGKVSRYFNGLAYLSYWDIYKNYYANKQEEEGVMIHANPSVSADWQTIDGYWVYQGYSYVDIFNSPRSNSSLSGDTKISIQLSGGQGSPDWDSLVITNASNGQDYVLSEIYNSKTITGNTCVWSDWNNSGTTPIDAVIGTQVVTGVVAPTWEGAPVLYRFPLENIDTMRENILKDVSATTPFIINKDTLAPYGLPMAENAELKIVAQQLNQEGLGIKTYQSDLFNNWISTEWIDGTNGVNEVTAVDTSGDSFTIDALNLANKVYNMLNRIAISGGTYDDWLDAVYTHERSRSVENPVYQGSLIKELSFQEVVSTADAYVSNGEGGQQPLGSLAGRGKLTSKNKGGNIKVKVDEPSYILGIVSITPRVDYSQGNKWDVNLKTMNDFHKPALDAIGFQDLIVDQMAWFSTVVSSDPTVDPIYRSAGKQPAWINYMTNVNQVRGSFAEQNNQMWMVLNRRYDSKVEPGVGIDDLTTYIDPSKFNHIFADASIDAQNFWVQISNKITARRKMSAKVIPNL